MCTIAAMARNFTALALLVALAPPASAEPTRVAWSEEQGTGITDLSISDDGRWVAFIEEGSDELRFLDTHSWEVVDATAACGNGSIGGVAVSGPDTDNLYKVYVGCSDGTLVGGTLDDSGLASIGEGSSSSADTGDDTTTSSGDWSTPVTLDGAGAVLAVETDGSSVYAVAEADSGNERVHKVGVADATESTSGYPSTFGQSGLADSWLGTSYLFISHGSQKVSKVQLSTGSISLSNENISADMGDMDAVNDNAAFLADADGGVIRFNPSGGTNSFDILLDDVDDDLVSVQALVIDETESFLAAYDSLGTSTGEVILYSFQASNLSVGDQELQRFSASPINEMVRLDGYVVAGGETGSLQVLTDRPWVEIEDIVPDDRVISGQEVNVSFTSDMAGDWEVYQSSASTGDTDLLASGDCEAGVAALASFTVGSSFDEGDNALFVLVSSDGKTGHDRGTVNVDNPPSKVSLSAEGVGFGDSQITVAFDGIDDADLGSYVVYVTVTEFEPSDWPEGSYGGPDFDGPDDLDLPLVVTDVTAGEDVSRTISPVTNEVTYYVAVRAIDEGGQESAMSNVVSVTPQPTIGAAELAGETGGYCGTRSAWGLAALGLAGLLALGRRRGVGVAVLLLALAAPRADAAVDEDEHPRANASIELRYGPFFPSNTAVTSVYGSSGHGVLWLEGGFRISRFAELDLGAGFYQELGTKVSVTDSTYHSSEHTMITAWPFTGALTVRLDVLHEQLLVPTARIGMDYWLWKENWYVNPDVGGDSSISGGELGWHWGIGANVLLDRFDSKHASWLATSTGIDDTYLVVDWRTQSLGQWGEDSSSILDGSMITIGLKLDM